MAAIGASPSLPVFWGMSLHRTDSGHSPWQRELLFVPPLAFAALVRALVNVTHDRGRSKIPSHANMARCQRSELRATLSFLGQYVPRTGSSEPGPT